jgi:serine/threonine protein kinase
MHPYKFWAEVDLVASTWPKKRVHEIKLTEYSHPNIVKLFGDYEPQDGNNRYICMRALVLSLARGPPLTYILKHKGSLGLPIAQKISSQLVNTVAFLHGRSYSS